MATPVPPEDMPDLPQRRPNPLYDRTGVVPYDDLPDELRPQVGRALAFERGVESGVPFAGDVRANVTARLRSTTPDEMQRRAMLGPLGIEREELLSRGGMSPKPGGMTMPADSMQAEPMVRPPTGPERPPEDEVLRAKAEEDQLRDAAWNQHPWMYGPGKVAGFVGSAYAAPEAVMGHIPRGVSLAQKLLPAAGVGARWGALYGASDAPTMSEVPRSTAEGGIMGAFFGPAAEVGLTGLGRAARAVPGWLAGAAEKNTVRSFGAPAAVGRLVDREGAARAPQVARSVLDEGINIRSPGDILRGTRDVMNEKYGPAIAQLTQEATNRGASFNLGRVISDFNARAAEMGKDPQQRPIIAAVKDYLSEVAKARGDWDPASRQLMQLSPVEAHQLRQNLDTFLRGVQKQLDPRGTLTKSVFNDVRHSVDDELGRAMNEAGLGAQWAPANAGYRNMSAASRLAKAGVKNEAVREAGAGEESALSKLKSLKLPGPKPSTKARVQNTLYRLLRPQGAGPNMTVRPSGGAAGYTGPQPLAGAEVEPGFTLWRPDANKPMSPGAWEARMAEAPPAPAPRPVEPTPDELARARSDVLANRRETKKYMKRTRKNPPMPEE